MTKRLPLGTLGDNAAAAIVIPQEELAAARRKRRTRDKPRDQAAIDRLFRPYEPPPNVGPEDRDALAADSAMAMDWGADSPFAWAAQNYLSSAIAEGQVFLGYPLLSALAVRAEYRIVSETIAYEATRQWIELKSSGKDEKTDQIKRIEERLKALKVQRRFRAASVQDGLFGRGHLYIDTGDTREDAELKTSLGNGHDAVTIAKFGRKRKKLLALRTVEPMWVYPTTYNSTDPLADDWYRPDRWYVMRREVHKTRLITFVSREVPDLMKPAYAFGGLSMSQMLKPYVDNWLRTRQSTADTLHSFSVSGLKTNMNARLQPGGKGVTDRVDFLNNLRDNGGALVLDKDTEEWFNVNIPLGGISDLQAATLEHIAAIAGIPVVKLLGIQPMGFNASSEGEIRSFYDRIKAYQEHLFRDPLQTVIDMIQLEEFGVVDPAIGFDFKDLWQLDEAGAAVVQKTKADVADAYVAMGALDPQEVREHIAKDKSSMFHGLDLSKPAPGVPGEEDEAGNEPPLGEGEQVPGASKPGGVAEPQQKPGGKGIAGLKPRDPGNGLASSITRHAAAAGGGGFGHETAGDGDDTDSKEKFPQSAVGFEHPAKGVNHCVMCQHFERPHGCELVEGKIEQDDWCRLWTHRGSVAK